MVAPIRSRLPSPAPPARVAVGRGATRRRAMLEAACRLFLERGFESTSVGDVVHRSGGSLATLYAWFGSKEGLFEAIVAEVSARITAGLDEPELESRPLDEALRAFGERVLDLALCPEGVRWHRMCVAEGHKFPVLRRALLRTGPGHIQERLAAYLEAQAAAGRLRIDDPARAALHFFALLKSDLYLAAVCGEPVRTSPADIRRQVRGAVAVFLHGYAAAIVPAGHPSRTKATRRRRRRSSRS